MLTGLALMVWIVDLGIHYLSTQSIMRFKIVQTAKDNESSSCEIMGSTNTQYSSVVRSIVQK